MFVPNQLTILSPDVVVKAIAKAYKRVTGRAASFAILALLVGQSALETGNFRSIHNFNLGNVRGTWNGDWTSFRAGEVDESGKEVFLDPGAANKFRAYPSLDIAAEDFIRELRKKPHWWNGLQTGNVVGYVKGLATRPVYMTANPAKYASVLEERAMHFHDEIKAHAGGATAVGMVVVAAASAGLTWSYLRRRSA